MQFEWLVKAMLYFSIVCSQGNSVRSKRFTLSHPPIWSHTFVIPNDQFGFPLAISPNQYAGYFPDILRPPPIHSLFVDGRRPTHTDIEAFTKNAAVETNRHRILAAQLGIPSFFDSVMELDETPDHLYSDTSFLTSFQEVNSRKPFPVQEQSRPTIRPVPKSGSASELLNRIGARDNFAKAPFYTLPGKPYSNAIMKETSSLPRDIVFSKGNPNEAEFFNVGNTRTMNHRQLTNYKNKYERLYAAENSNDKTFAVRRVNAEE